MGRRNRNHGLSVFRAAMKEAGDPQETLKVIHIAGTNGKGSTANMIAHILMSEGFRTGLFTSPHLMSHRDRIRIDDEWIPAETYQKYLTENIGIIEKYDLGMFEIVTMIAYLYYADQHVDYAVMETGIGGRFDATNVVSKPELCVITTIGFDHMAMLGNRLSQIAFEKAGIIQPNSRCVCGDLDPGARTVIRRNAFRKGARVIFCPRYDDRGPGKFRFRDQLWQIDAGGEYQKANTALALESAFLLGIDLTKESIHETVRTTMWAGRFETVGEHLPVILDGAHNEEGIRALSESLKHLPRPRIVVFSALKDKPAAKMAEMVSRESEQMIVTSFKDDRADTVSHMMTKGSIAEADWQKAIDLAKEKAGSSGTVIVSGSLHFISAVREKLKP